MTLASAQTCPTCDGHVIETGDFCKTCGGTGFVGLSEEESKRQREAILQRVDWQKSNRTIDNFVHGRDDLDALRHGTEVGGEDYTHIEQLPEKEV